MSLIKIFLDTLSLFLFLPLYWLYAIIWFIAFRGRLNDYPRIQKDETAKHLIFATISIFAFIIFGNAFIKEISTTKESEKVVTNDKYLETNELLEDTSESDDLTVYASLIDYNNSADYIETTSTKSSIDYDYEPTGGISPYYKSPVEEDDYSEPIYYESYVDSGNNYEQTIEKDYNYESYNANNKTSIDNDNLPLGNSTLVWIDDTADKYHSSSDTPKHPNAKMDAPRQVTLTEALNMGKKPCGICYR